MDCHMTQKKYKRLELEKCVSRFFSLNAKSKSFCCHRVGMRIRKKSHGGEKLFWYEISPRNPAAPLRSNLWILHTLILLKSQENSWYPPSPSFHNHSFLVWIQNFNNTKNTKLAFYFYQRSSKALLEDWLELYKTYQVTWIKYYSAMSKAADRIWAPGYFVTNLVITKFNDEFVDT